MFSNGSHYLNDTGAFLLQLKLWFNERNVGTESRWMSEGKPQSLYIQVDNSDIVLGVISVKSRCLRVLFGKQLFQEGPPVNSGALHAA